MLRSIRVTQRRLPHIVLPTKTAVTQELKRFISMLIGVTMVSFGYTVFQVPHSIGAGGVTGLGIIVHHFVGLPVGLTFWILNLPLLLLGFFYLGRWKFLWRTLIAATIFSIMTDWMVIYLPQLLPQFPLTDDLLLSTIYGGIVGGIGGGFIFRAGGTMGGTGVIGRVIQKKTGKPLSQVYFYTDGVIILAAGFVFGWEIALYGFLMLFLNGLAADYTLEGPSVTRTATIITNHPHVMVAGLIEQLHRGVSFWKITGGYTGHDHYLVFCTVSRSQVGALKQLVAEVDNHAFVTIGLSHNALGADFTPMPHVEKPR